MSDSPKARNTNPKLASLTCPPEMADMPNWLPWRRVTIPSREKPAKVPFWTTLERRRGKQGSPEDRAKLVTFEVAKACAIQHGFDGVGFALLPGSPIVALDFDDVMQDPEYYEPLLRALENTYAEFSPSGNGIRAFIRQGDADHGGFAFKDLKSHKMAGHPFTFEVFANAGWVTFTGDHV